MRGERRIGRFNIPNERSSIIAGTSSELVRTVGNSVQWYVFDAASTVVDPIYDVGSSDPSTGGRKWFQPLTVPVIKAVLYQGVSMQNDRGFYNTDLLRITMNMDVIEQGTNLLGMNASNMPHFENILTNTDNFLLDRIAFRNEIFTPDRIQPMGLVNNKYTVLSMDCLQVNAEELVNDPQFAAYASYSAYNDNAFGTNPVTLPPSIQGETIIELTIDGGQA
jgi:hypothetical protein